MDGHLGLLLELGPTRVRDALQDGVASAELRRRDLHRPMRGIRSAVPVTDLDAVVARLDGRQFVSHVAAARVWGLPVATRFRDRGVDVSTLVPHHAPRAAGIIPHRLDEEHVELALIGGIAVTTPCETWRHLSTLMTTDELIEVGDALVRRRHPLATPDQLLRSLGRHRGARGVRRLRVAHDLVRPGTDSRRETRLRLLLVRNGMPEPIVNHRLDLPGYGTAYADLAYPDARVAVEYDGRHHRDPITFERDIRRLEAFAAARWMVVRILAEHLSDPASIVRRVQDAIRANDRF